MGSTEVEALRSALSTLAAQRAALGETAYLAASEALRDRIRALEPEAQAPEGEWKQVTVVFADISGFSGIAELSDAEDLRNSVNSCFQLLGDVVTRYGGYIDKFIGDEVMVLFGAPVAMEDHASRSLYAALAMRDALAAFNREHAKLRERPLNLHFGINSGLVVAGSIGSEGRRDYTVMGDPVNVAARLVARAEQGEILVGEATRRLGGHDFEFEDLGMIEVEGREQPVAASRLQRARFAVPLRGGPRVRTPMFGRGREMRTLQDAYEDVVKTGKPRTLVVLGPAGIGKSRLQLEFGGWLRREVLGVTMLSGAAVPHMKSAPYFVIADLLRCWLDVSQVDSAAAIADRLRENSDQIGLSDALTVDGLAATLGIVSDGSGFQKLRPEERMNRIFGATQALIRKLAARGPLVVVVEDLHWADDLSVEVLLHLRDIEGPLLLLVLSRPHQEAKGGQALQDPRFEVPGEDVIGLHELDDGASAEFVASLAPPSLVFPADLREAVVEKGQGNPFYLEAIVGSLLEQGLAAEGTLRQAVQPRQLAVPDTVWGVLAERIDLLPAGEKHVIQSAAVAGRVFWEGLLTYLTGSDAAPGLKLLGQRNLIDLEGPAPFLNDWQWHFRHILVQEVAYSGLLQEHRKAAHRRTGEWLEERLGDRRGEYAALLTHHYTNSEDWSKAAEYDEIAADAAASLFAFDQARDFYLQALAALRLLGSEDGTRRRRLEAILKLASASYYSPTQDILDAILEARETAEQLGDPESKVRLMVALASWQLMAGLGTEAVETAQATIAEATALGLQKLLSVPLSLLGRAIFVLGEFERCIGILENSRTLAEAAWDDPLTRFHLGPTLGYLAMAMQQLGDLDQAEDLNRRCLELAEQTRDSRQIAAAHIFYGGTASTLGRLDRAYRHLTQAAEMFESRADPVAYFVCLGFLGYCYIQMGELERASELLDTSLRNAAAIKSFIFVPYFRAYRAELHVLRGEIDRASDEARAAIELAIQTRQPYGEALARRILAWSLHYSDPGARNEAEEEFRKALDIQRTAGVRSYICRLLFEYAEYLRRIGEHKLAAGTEAEAQALKDRLGLYWLPVPPPVPAAAVKA